MTTQELLTLALFAVFHTAGFIWWMSKITTTLDVLSKTIDVMSKQINQNEAVFAKKEDVAKDIFYHEKRIDAIGAKLDSIK